jgi:hypothetical protein
MDVVAYTAEHEAQWDEFCARSVNATLLHSRRFLSYHGDRFTDRSCLLLDSGKLVGVFPAAHSSQGSAAQLTSHPGATFGGIVHQGWLTGTRMLQGLSTLGDWYASRGVEKLLYKAVPYFHCKVPAQDDSYALFRLGGKRVRCDLSCTVDLASGTPVSDRRRRSLKKAQSRVTISWERERLHALWNVICENLSRKHGAKPVHSVEELSLLCDRFPDENKVCAALAEGRVVAGVILFNSIRAWHAQYIAADETGYQISALDAVFASVLEAARVAEARYFDFGISNEDQGMTLNEGLFRFKSEFGGGGTVHEFYELDLS